MSRFIGKGTRATLAGAVVTGALLGATTLARTADPGPAVAGEHSASAPASACAGS